MTYMQLAKEFARSGEQELDFAEALRKLTLVFAEAGTPGKLMDYQIDNHPNLPTGFGECSHCKEEGYLNPSGLCTPCDMQMVRELERGY